MCAVSSSQLAVGRAPEHLRGAGCALGIDEAWRAFTPHLRPHGIEPQVAECRRLAEAERDPDVRYHPVFVGLEDAHPLRAHQGVTEAADRYHPRFGRVGALRALKRRRSEVVVGVEATDRWGDQSLRRSASRSATHSRAAVGSVDFVRIDTDGADFEMIASAENAIRRAGILGFLVETVSPDP